VKRHSIGLMAAMVMLYMPAIGEGITRSRREPDWWGDAKYPVDTGRRAEKDERALAKAEAKRARRAAKRVPQP